METEKRKILKVTADNPEGQMFISALNFPVQEFDIESCIRSKIDSDPETFLGQFDGSVGREVAKCKIYHNLETRDHTFSCGMKGQVANKLVIVVDLSGTAIQPHSYFAEEFCNKVVDVLDETVNGIFENSDVEDEDDTSEDFWEDDEPAGGGDHGRGMVP